MEIMVLRNGQTKSNKLLINQKSVKLWQLQEQLNLKLTDVKIVK